MQKTKDQIAISEKETNLFTNWTKITSRIKILIVEPSNNIIQV